MNINLEKIAVAVRLLRTAQKLAEEAVTEMGTTNEPDVSYESYKVVRDRVAAAHTELQHAVETLRIVRDGIRIRQ
jgi:hypothetical protein